MECDQTKCRKQKTLHQEGWERREGMQGGEEVDTEKECEWEEKGDLAGMENVSLDLAAKRKSAHFNRDPRCEEADNQSRKGSADEGWH